MSVPLDGLRRATNKGRRTLMRFLYLCLLIFFLRLRTTESSRMLAPACSSSLSASSASRNDCLKTSIARMASAPSAEMPRSAVACEARCETASWRKSECVKYVSSSSKMAVVEGDRRLPAAATASA